MSYDEFFRVSSCKATKQTWNKLQITHEGTSDVKRARMNSLMHEYELFHMKNGEDISDMQRRFTHIVNQLNGLGKSISDKQQINKIVRCLTREWQPKITAIAESRDLATMTIATLFGKLKEHEMELHRLNDHEKKEKKKRGLSLKAYVSKESLDSDEGEEVEEDEDSKVDMGLLVRKFKRFLKKKKSFNKKPSNFFSKKNTSKAESSTSNVKFYECGKLRHYKNEYPKLQKKDKHDNHESKDKKNKKSRRAYIAWEENHMDSSEDSEEQEANLCLMTNHQSDNEDEVNELPLPMMNYKMPLMNFIVNI